MELLLAFLVLQALPATEENDLVSSQEAPVMAKPMPSSSSRGIMIPQGTPIRVELKDRLSTKITQKGETFDLEVIEDIKVDGMMVIPAGTLAVGEVSRSDAKGAFGKSGKLEARILYVKLKGRTVRVSGTLAVAGQGGTTETVLTAIAAGTLAFAVTGKSAVLEPGTELFVHTERPVFIGADAELTE